MHPETVCAAGNSLACFARVIEISSRIIVGVLARKTNVCFNKTQFRKVYISNTGRGNGATGVHRAFSDGYQEESIEHSLMDPKRGRRSTKCTTVCELETYMLALQLPVRLSLAYWQSNQCQLQQTINVSFNKTINVSFNK